MSNAIHWSPASFCAKCAMWQIFNWFFFFIFYFGLHWTRKWNVLPKSCCCIKISLSFVVGLIKTSDVVHYCFTVCLFNVSEIQVGCLLWRLNQRMMTKDRQLSSGSVQETKSKQLFQSRMWTLSYLDTWSALLHRWSVLMSLEGACYLWCSLLSDLTQGLWLGSTTWYFFFFFSFNWLILLFFFLICAWWLSEGIWVQLRQLTFWYSQSHVQAKEEE